MPAPFQWTEEKKCQMIAAYKQGEGTIAIAKRFHLRHESVTSMLQEQGITIRKPTQFARTHACNHTYFHSIDTEEQAYWLGFLTADGCITTGNRITVHLGIIDCSHLYKLKDALQATQKVSTNNHSCSFAICSPEMAKDLAMHGILPKKTFSTRPGQVAPEITRHYWRGIIDGDGHIRPDGKCMTLVGDYDIIASFQKFALTHCPDIKAKICRKENIYSFAIYKRTPDMLALLYNDAMVYLDRKFEQVQRILNAQL